MTFKIETMAERHRTTFKLSGQIQQDDLGGLKAQMQVSAPLVVLDLEEVSLVDVSVIQFLGDCETEGMKIRNCSAYIREWIQRERNR